MVRMKSFLIVTLTEIFKTEKSNFIGNELELD